MGLLKMRLQREKEQKREAISKLLSSFTVTAVVTVAVVAIRANPPTADLTLRAVGDEIVYRATVADPDQKISFDTLVLSITSPNLSYEEDMTLGLTMGTFTMTSPSTEYKVAVKASLGYGLETLASATITSKGTLSGAVAEVELDPSIDLNSQPYSLAYNIRTLYDDPRQELSDLTLYYDFVETSVYENSSSESSESSDSQSYSSEIPAYAYTPNYYYSVPISETDQVSMISDIPNWNYTVFLRLAGTKVSDQSTVILDEMTFTTPFNINASFYINDLGSDYATFYISPSEVAKVDPVFTLKMFDVDETLIQSIPLSFQTETVSEGEWESSGLTYTYRWAQVTVDGLNPLTFYHADLYAAYTDPNTTEEVDRVLSTLPFNTFPHYTVDVSHTETETTYEFTITVNDPDLIFQDFYFNMFDTTTEYEQYLQYGNFVTQSQGAERIYTASIAKPTVDSFRLEILTTKAYEGTYYYGCLLYTLEG